MLGKTPQQAGDLTPHELIDLWRGYLWRKQQQENTLASLVTVWIANSAGKTFKKKLTIKDIFSDGRFKNTKWTTEDEELLAELERGRR